MTAQQWDVAVIGALAHGQWRTTTEISQIVSQRRNASDTAKPAILRLVASGVLEQRGSFVTDRRPQFRLTKCGL